VIPSNVSAKGATPFIASSTCSRSSCVVRSLSNGKTRVMCDGRNPAKGSKRCRIGSTEAMSDGDGIIMIARRFDVLRKIG
jgi:hypothetical protein